MSPSTHFFRLSIHFKIRLRIFNRKGLTPAARPGILWPVSSGPTLARLDARGGMVTLFA
jgi:hypothetical protein